jgi:prepilin-type N-terminal cleavage/methylation domain-containing protein
LGLQHSGQRGISLTETLVALAILAIISAALVGGLYVSIKGNEVVRTHISADGLARYELEYVKHSNVWSPTSWTYTLPGAAPSWDIAHNSIPVEYLGYSVTVTAALLSSSSDASILQKITATVSYNSKQVVSIDTYRTQ